MTSVDRQTARIRAAEEKARRKLCSDAANIVREKLTEYRLLGLMSRNAIDWMSRLIDDLEDGAVRK
jgi:hypothetical protein